MSDHILNTGESLTLAAVNRMLTRLSEAHHHACECELCEARMLTDVQDMPKLGWAVNGVTLVSGE